MKKIYEFVSRFKTSISLDQSLIVEKDDRYFLLDGKLKSIIKKDFLYAGIYLGKTKNDAFFPSFNLLIMLSKADPNRIVVDNKTEWLFICGRDIFKQGITHLSKPGKKGEYTLILNAYSDCLGFGRILHYIDTKDKSKIAVKNIADIGDFLRRER